MSAGPGAAGSSSRGGEGASRSGLSRADLARVAALRVALSGAVLLFGFRSVSDDDFSRVVIAQQLVHAPKLDPSGTSWLPFPFWLDGAAMLVLGRSLLVAHLVAVLLGAAASVLVAIAAHRLTNERRAALFAGHLATLFGWSAWLGVATVPELFTAALTLFAAASLATRSPRDRLLGALALLAATLSRYEPWPVAAAFALWNAADVARGRLARTAPRDAPVDLRDAPIDLRDAPIDLRDVPVDLRDVPLDLRDAPAPRRFAAATGAIASIVAIAGPVLWIAWNRVSHGDAFHFVARVTAYRRALGETANESTLARFAAYPGALVREMPEIVIPAAIAASLLVTPRARAAVLAPLHACAAPLALAAVQIVALSLALVKDGAPTHHPERAVLFPALALVVFLAALAPAVMSDPPRAPHAPPGAARATRRAHLARRAVAAAALLLAVRAVLGPPLARWVGPTRPTLFAHLVRQMTPREALIDRRAEVEIGALAADAVPAGAKIFLEDVEDYGYFAILAGSGRPEDFVLGADPDPRAPKKTPVFSEDDELEYQLWLRARGITHVIARGGEQVAHLRWGAPPLQENARFSLWKLP